MGKQSTEPTRQSRPTWETLEDWMRGQVQALSHRVLEDEVTEFVGRTKSQRRAAVDAPAGYRSGSGKPRRLTLCCGTIAVQRPRVRDREERFESRVLPLCKRKSTKVDDVVPELSLHGLAQGDFELALLGLRGEEAPLSSSPSRGSRRSGRPSWRKGRAGGSTAWTRCVAGWTASM